MDANANAGEGSSRRWRRRGDRRTRIDMAELRRKYPPSEEPPLTPATDERMRKIVDAITRCEAARIAAGLPIPSSYSITVSPPSSPPPS